MKRILERAWIALSLAFVASLVWAFMTMRGDSFWSLAGGDWVLSHGAIPARDPFAFTSVNAPFVLTMPAFQVGGAWLVAHAGLRAFMLACTLAIASGAAVLWLSSARSFAARVATFPLVVFYVLVDAEDISARGQSLGDLAFALLLVLLFRGRHREDRAPAPWWCFLLLGAAWANVHPSFLIAIALPLALAAASLLDRREDRVALAPLLFASLAAAAGAFLNPQPLLLVTDAVKLVFDPTTSHVDLFNSPRFREPLWALAPASGIALATLRLVRGEARSRTADAALLFAFVAATCAARRYGTLLVALEIAIAGPLLERELPALGRRWFLPLSAAAVFFAAGTAAFALEEKDPLALVPAAAVAAIDKLHTPDRVVNTYYWGGYLEWVWAGRRKVFIDGRNQYFGNGTFDDEHRLEELAAWPDVLDAYEARTVLWLRHAPLDEALAADPRWAIVYSDAMAVVYVRR